MFTAFRATTVSLLIAGCAVPTASAVWARYFLSPEGLLNPDMVEGPAILPSSFGTDPVIDTSLQDSVRLYLWVELAPERTDIIGFDIAFRTTGDVFIVGTHLWNNTFTAGFPPSRWSSFPGTSNSGTPSQQVDVSFTLRAALGDGVSNGPQSAVDDQYVASINSVLVGYIEVQGRNGGVHVMHQQSGWIQLDSANRLYLGFDDAGGVHPDAGPYDNASPEALLVLLGDMNCDGVLSVSDISGFVLALTNPVDYAVQFPHCNGTSADMNQDGHVTVSDIGLFVQALTAG